MVWDSVAQDFYPFTVKREGYTPFMYADQLNLVTTGEGLLIDAGPPHSTVVSAGYMAPAFNYTWYHRGAGWTPNNPVTAGLATHDEIADDWTRVKLAGSEAQGGFHYKDISQLTLSAEDMQRLFDETFSRFENTLRGYFPQWDQWPADAQKAAMSMAWGMGPGFPETFPKFTAAVNMFDFATAAKESFGRGLGGTDPDHRAGRNAENEQMFNIAANVINTNSDRSELHFVEGQGVVPTPRGSFPTPATPTASNTKFSVVGVAAAIGGIGAIGYGLYQLDREYGFVDSSLDYLNALRRKYT